MAYMNNAEEFATRHSGVIALLGYFDSEHLPEYLKKASKPCQELALQMVRGLRDDPELTAGLRKLLEAKDCFVRAALAMRNDRLCEDPGCPAFGVYNHLEHNWHL